MKKALLAALAGALVVAMALPAAAVTTKVNGYFRARGIMADTNQSKDAIPDKLYDQRFRAKVNLGLNDYVSVVYYGEVDMQYGDAGYGKGALLKVDGDQVYSDEDGKKPIRLPGTRNDGGGLGGDTVNIETKNLYVAVKIPDTGLSFKVGLMGYASGLDGLLFNADMAGIRADGTFGPAKVTLGAHKWQEGAFNKEDDIDLYSAKVHFMPMEGTKLSGIWYWVNSQQGKDGTNASTAPKGSYHYLAVKGSTKIAMADLSGWFLYNTGTADEATDDGKDVDVGGWAATVKGAATFGSVKTALRFVYVSGDDDTTDNDYNSVVFPAAIADSFPLYDLGLMIMTADVYGNTYFQNGFFYDDALRDGRGGWALAAKANTEFAGFHAQGAIGYFAALEDAPKGGDKKEGTSLGTELAVRVGKKIADGAVDVSINASYAWLGDFYDKTINDKDDPDGQYEAYLMVNVPY